MKTTKLACVVTFLITLILTSFTTSSCTKEKTIVERDTIETVLIKKDTIIIKDTIVNDSLLTSASWEIIEAIGVMGNTSLRYERGGSSNNWNVAGDYYVFNKDNRGYMYDGANTRHEILSWNLVKTGERRKLILLYQNDASGFYTTLITWDNLVYKNGNLQYSDYYRDALTWSNYHGQAIRAPKK
jgi:hypothetical protein